MKPHLEIKTLLVDCLLIENDRIGNVDTRSPTRLPHKSRAAPHETRRMPLTSPPPRRRQSRGSIGPRLDATSASFAEPRSSATKASHASALSPAHGARGAPDAPLSANASSRVAALRERTLASTCAALRVAEQTERVAGATLRELDAQSQSLERTRKSLEEAEKGAEEGERVLDEMRGCFSVRIACFSFVRSRGRSRPRTDPEPNGGVADETRVTRVESRDENRTTAAATTAAATTTTSRASRPTSSEGPVSVQEIASHTDDAIRTNATALSGAMDSLRIASEAMGEKLDEQTRTVDDVGARAAALRVRLARAETRGATGRRARS